MEVSREFGDDPDDGESHAGEQSHFPRLAQHEEEEEAEAGRVPHQQTQLLAQGLAHVVGVRGDAGHQHACQKGGRFFYFFCTVTSKLNKMSTTQETKNKFRIRCSVKTELSQSRREVTSDFNRHFFFSSLV